MNTPNKKGQTKPSTDPTAEIVERTATLELSSNKSNSSQQVQAPTASATSTIRIIPRVTGPTSKLQAVASVYKIAPAPPPIKRPTTSIPSGVASTATNYSSPNSLPPVKMPIQQNVTNTNTESTADTLDEAEDSELDEDENSKQDEDTALIYAFYIPLKLKIDGKKYYPVKIGKMDPNLPGFGTRFNQLKGPWQGVLQLPTTNNITEFYKCMEEGDEWDDCLDHLNFDTNHTMFLLKGIKENEPTIRAALLLKYGGFVLPSSVISSLLAVVQKKNDSDPKQIGLPTVVQKKKSKQIGPTEYIALHKVDIDEIRDTFAEGNLSIISHPVILRKNKTDFYVSATAGLLFTENEPEPGPGIFRAQVNLRKNEPK